jgi:hypothetical protein
MHHTAAHRLAQRARLVRTRSPGETVPAMAAQVGLLALRVWAWTYPSDRHNLTGLTDTPGHDELVRGTAIVLAHTKPKSLGLHSRPGTGAVAAGPTEAPWATCDPCDALEVAADRRLSVEAPA